VGGFTRDDLSAFFRRIYQPSNIVIAAAGHLEHRDVSRLVERHFGGLQPGRNGGSVQAPKPASRIVTRSKKELEQVHLCLGTPAYHQGHEQRYAAYILNTILGGSMSSRLFQNVREKRGLVYSISSGVTAYRDAGNLTVYAGTSLDSVDEVVRLTLLEFRRLKDEPLPAEELRRAKDHLKGSLMLSLENTGSRMSHLARQEIYYGRQMGMDETLSRIEDVGAPDVQKVANEILVGSITMSLLGNLKGYRPKPSQLRL
jgi:predicted Zn-dependent peptidase